MDSAKSLVKYLMQKGYEISVSDEKGIIQDKTIVHSKILEAINSVDECVIYAYLFGVESGFALIVNGLDPVERVTDYSDNELFNQWNKSFTED